MTDTNGHSVPIAVPSDVVIVETPAPKPRKPRTKKPKLRRYEVFAMRNGRAEVLCEFQAENDAAAAKYFDDVIPKGQKATFREVRGGK